MIKLTVEGQPMVVDIHNIVRVLKTKGGCVVQLQGCNGIEVEETYEGVTAALVRERGPFTSVGGDQ